MEDEGLLQAGMEIGEQIDARLQALARKNSLDFIATCAVWVA